MTTNSDGRKTPLHMRDDSEDEASLLPSEQEVNAAVAAKNSGAGAEGDKKHGAERGEKEMEHQKIEVVKDLIKKRQAKVGEVELHPDINYTDFTKDGPGLSSKASMGDDGMINIWVDLKRALPDIHADYAKSVTEYATDPKGGEDCPQLNIVIFIVGSRGDVQPYLSLALHLIKSHNHRVRIATHPDFEKFVLGANKHLKDVKGKNGSSLEGTLEFFNAGGDPKSLMAYMVKNPGLLPGWTSLTNGDVLSKRKMTAEMLQGFFRSITSPDPVSSKPFAADAIISNPPAFAHCHVAEAFGLPLHLTFTMPWSPSTAFSHPLVNIKSSNAEKDLTNVLTFSFADMMQWQGLGDIINSFRGLTLGLEPLTIRSGPSLLDRLKVPWTYCWSETLIPKPDDWREHIDISGFYFLEADTDFEPDADLKKFLEKGDAPIYIGFGSVVVEDATAMTQTIFDAVEKAGVRALVSAGWGGLGGTEVPEEVFILKGNIPHDWLFAEGRVSAVCHHGGAGTTAIGLRNGLPTIVVPFFGDQKFWGEMIHRSGAGPQPIPNKELTSEKLAGALRYAASVEAKAAAGKMGERIRAEKGEEKGVKSFHRHLPLKTMRCDLQPNKAGQWWYPQQLLRLSGEAAVVLSEAGKLRLNDLEPLRAKEYQARYKANDPVSGATSDLLTTVANHCGDAMQLMVDPQKGAASFATVMPQGVMDLFSGFHSGMDAIPGRLGSQVREKGRVDGLASGVKEAGKGLMYGWWDGITGLVTEPIAGGQKEGALGVLKGMGRSYVNVWARPAAGIAGAFALPIQGAYMTMQRKIAGVPQQAIREPRIALSHLHAANLSQEERSSIITIFNDAATKTEERKGYYKRKAEVFLSNMKKEQAAKNKQAVKDSKGGEWGDEEEEGFTLKDGEDTGYIQEGELKRMSKEERGNMQEMEKSGYDRASKELEDEQGRHEAGLR